MVRNFLLSAFRSLNKNRFFSTLNISGLAIGMAVFLMMTHYVWFERSYEDFVHNGDDIYRVTLKTYLNGELAVASAENYPGVGPALAHDFPEVLDYARLYNMGYKNNVIVTYEDADPAPIAFKHRKLLYADSSFLPMMGYPLVMGDARTALAEPFTAVVSERYARMYFGNDNPVGKMLRLRDDDFNNELVKVTGVFRDLPANTHLKFELLLSYETLFSRFETAPARYGQSWQRKDMYTFVQLRPGTDPSALEEKMKAMPDNYNPSLKARNQRDVLSLQPLKDIHLTSNLAEEAEANGNARAVRFIGLIGVFVLVIAWINYVNLSTAKAMERAREVGVRKVMGASRGELLRQFLLEAAWTNLVSVVIAAGLVLLTLPAFNNLAGTTFELRDVTTPASVALVCSLWLAGTLLSGFYPAMVLSSFRPTAILKGKYKDSSGGIILRKFLVVFQFVMSIVLIAGTLIVYRQLNFMMNQDIGMNIDQVLVVERPGISPPDREAYMSAVDVFRNGLKTHPSVVGVSTSVTIPGKQREYLAAVKRYGASDDQFVSVRFNSMDYEFIDVFKMTLLAGRGFSEAHPSDQDTAVVLSESAARLLGFATPADAVGQTLAVPAYEYYPIVVGVVNDYHQESLKESLDPMMFYCTAYTGEFYSIRVATSDLGACIAHVKAAWDKAFAGNPFDFFFLDEYFNRQYANEQKLGMIASSLAGLAIFVGCLGLLGLSAYTAGQRTREIGIRKALGSSERGIFVLLSSDYLRLIAIAIVLAVPLVWFVMDRWLESFPYRIAVSSVSFIIAGASVLVIALATVSFQTIKAARTNPVESLRQE